MNAPNCIVSMGNDIEANRLWAPSMKWLYYWIHIKRIIFVGWDSTQNKYVDGWITWYLSLAFFQFWNLNCNTKQLFVSHQCCDGHSPVKSMKCFSPRSYTYISVFFVHSSQTLEKWIFQWLNCGNQYINIIQGLNQFFWFINYYIEI